jgi:hypothetical protein
MYSVLPFLVFVTLPSRPSSRFHPISPCLCLFSVPSAFSALKSPCTLSCQLARRPIQPNRFPPFPHPVNIAATPTPAIPFRSIVSAHFPSPPGVVVTPNSLSLHSQWVPGSTPPPTPLNATLTKKPGGAASDPHGPLPRFVTSLLRYVLTSIPLHYF